MTKHKPILAFFGASLLASYLVVGYFTNTMLIAIDWVETVTIWHKVYQYYIVTFTYNIIPTLILSVVAPLLFALLWRKHR